MPKRHPILAIQSPSRHQMAPKPCCGTRRNVASAFRILAVSAFLVASPSSFCSENLVPSGDFEEEHLIIQWSPTKAAVQESEEKASGDHSLRFTVSLSDVVSPELIEVDPEQHYELRAFIKEPEVKNAPEYVSAKVFIGLLPYDQYEQRIPPLAVWTFPNTETTLARDAAKGDTVVYLTGEPWETRAPFIGTGIAFDVKEDRSDLPNFSAIGMDNKVGVKDGMAVVTLQSPLDQSWPAGTRVRQHRYADFPASFVEALPTTWTEHSMEIGGVSSPDAVNMREFWPGVKYVRVVIGVRPQAAATGKLPAGEHAVDVLIDDVSFTSQ